MLLRQAYTSQELKSRVIAQKESRPAIIEGLVHQKSVIMNSSDPGVGKSTVNAVIIAQSSIGLPVFGQLFVPKPVVSYYIPFERGAQEIEERFKHIQTVIPLEYDNIYINEKFMGMNVINENHADEIIMNISNDVGERKIDIIYLDPIYSSVAGGLSGDEKASLFTRFSTRLQVEFDCAIFMSHHTVKTSYSSETGQVIEKEDPFYGSQWLKAHCTGGFYMKRSINDTGPILINKKDSHSCLLPKISLTYEPETYTVFMQGIDKSIPAKDRLIMAYRTFKKSNKTVTFREIQGCMMGVSDSHLRDLLRTPPFNTAFKKVNSIGTNTLYQPIEEIWYLTSPLPYSLEREDRTPDTPLFLASLFR